MLKKMILGLFAMVLVIACPAAKKNLRKAKNVIMGGDQKSVDLGKKIGSLNGERRSSSSGSSINTSNPDLPDFVMTADNFSLDNPKAALKYLSEAINVKETLAARGGFFKDDAEDFEEDSAAGGSYKFVDTNNESDKTNTIKDMLGIDINDKPFEKWSEFKESDESKRNGDLIRKHPNFQTPGYDITSTHAYDVYTYYYKNGYKKYDDSPDIKHGQFTGVKNLNTDRVTLKGGFEMKLPGIQGDNKTVKVSFGGGRDKDDVTDHSDNVVIARGNIAEQGIVYIGAGDEYNAIQYDLANLTATQKEEVESLGLFKAKVKEGLVK